jgi:hypothetical protein
MLNKHPHNWIQSPLGHGNMYCTKCCVTDLEAAVLDIKYCTKTNVLDMKYCAKAAEPPKPANDKVTDDAL